MTEEQARKAIEYLEYISGKQGSMEQRQCDAQGSGTDASRMLEQWTRGKHANVSEAARTFLRRRVILCASFRATSYENIFSEKDFVRAEKQVFKFYEQFSRGIFSGSYDTANYAEIGDSLAYLPIW